MISLADPRVGEAMQQLRLQAAAVLAAKANCRADDVRVEKQVTITFAHVLVDPTGTHRVELILPLVTGALLHRGPDCGCAVHPPAGGARG